MFKIKNINYAYTTRKNKINFQKNEIRNRVINYNQPNSIGDMKLSVQNEGDGWKICDGSSLNIKEYQDLFNIIGTSFGSISINEFNLPDFTSRVIGVFGKSQIIGTSLTERKMGDKIGTETETLNIEQLPKHSHKGSTENGGLHTHINKLSEIKIKEQINMRDGLVSIQIPAKHEIDNHLITSFTNQSGVHQHRFISSEVGSGEPHNNIQPTLFGCNVLIYSKKTHIKI
jgi:microcystin-dependent protein